MVPRASAHASHAAPHAPAQAGRAPPLLYTSPDLGEVAEWLKALAC